MGPAAQAPGLSYRYPVSMKRILLVLALTLLARPAAADFHALFDGLGIPPGYAEQQEAMRQFKLQQERDAKARGSVGKQVGDVFLPSRVPSQKPLCVFQGVARLMGVEAAAESAVPRVWFASRTLLEDYNEWIYSETHKWETPAARKIETRYLPVNNVIFLDDENASYSSKRTIDDALAGQAALYYQRKAGVDPASAEAKQRAAEIELQFNAQYTARKASACQAPSR